MIVQSQQGITLVGGGEWSDADLTEALGLAPTLVAADGGANGLISAGHQPAAVIGDLDSLHPQHRVPLGNRLHRIAEQDSTDFDKCLRSLQAPFVLAIGFSGKRLDHTLAAMSSLVRFGSARVVLLGPADLCVLAPPRVELPVTEGQRVSLFPMADVTGRSVGLHWPIDGIRFGPAEMIGTSNRATRPAVRLEFDRRGMLLLLERGALHSALPALLAVPDWPAARDD